MATNRQPVCTADEALERLKAGNARFVSGHAHFPTVQKEILAEMARGQHPYATILGCSDSRVPPELVFDAGFGELFVIRVAGNVLGPAVLGTLQYAGSHLHTPLFVVLGHEGCGAVSAALEWKFRGAAQKSRVETVNGSIDVAFDRSPSIRYDLETVDGHHEGDFDMPVEGKFGPKEARGSYNGGAETLHCETVNGTIRLKTTSSSGTASK
jgi:carbonic anhydrase